VCVCVCDYRFVCPSALKNHMSTFHINFCTYYLWPWLGRPLTTVPYNMYFRFCGWRHVFTQLSINISPQRKHINTRQNIFSSLCLVELPDGGTGGKVWQLQLPCLCFGYRIAPFWVTVKVICLMSLFECSFLYSCAADDKISTNSVSCSPSAIPKHLVLGHCSPDV